MPYYSANQFIIFRTIFGCYLAWHFYTIISYGPEIFGPNGMVPNPAIMPTWGIFPSVLHIPKNEIFVKIYLAMLSIASIIFAIGLQRRIMSIFIWYGWAYLLNRNILISNPGIPYVGWLLIACAIIPTGEGYIWDLFKKQPKNNEWYMPSVIYWGAYFLMALGYTISGIHKLQCQSWLDGSTLYHILSSVLAHDNWITNFLLASPAIVLRIHTWISLAAEILFLPLGLFYHVRKWYWLMFIAIHLGILCTINFTDLTLGVLMVHIFTFDNRWLNSLRSSRYARPRKRLHYANA